MEQGIIIGSESEQKSTVDFNLKTDHKGEDYKILNKPEGKISDIGCFVLFATNIDDMRRIGLCYEWQEPIGKSIIKAFTFEIPFEFQDDIRLLVKENAELQAGFEIELDQIEYLGKSFIVSGSGNFCHQFGVTVDKRTQKIKTSTDPAIVSSSHFWAMNEEIQHMEDWMCQLTCIKRYTSKNHAIVISSNGNQQ